MIDWSTYTDEELTAEFASVYAEQTRRTRIATSEDQMKQINSQYLADTGVVVGDAWRQPIGAHDAYPKDWIVTHNDDEWRSLVDGNVWEPGVANWAINSGEEWPTWVSPTGATDAYVAGAKVSHSDKHWISDLDANVWEPGVYGWTESL